MAGPLKARAQMIFPLHTVRKLLHTRIRYVAVQEPESVCERVSRSTAEICAYDTITCQRQGQQEHC